jgi:hypothetical protein
MDFREGDNNYICNLLGRRVYREKRKGKNAKDVTIPVHPELLSYIKNRVGE